MADDTPTADEPWRGAIARFVVVQGWLLGHAVELASDRATLGRSESCAVCIPLGDLSRRHAEIEQRDGVYFLRDLGSRNGTFVNGERLGAQPQSLQVGDTVRLGGAVAFRFTLVDPAEAEALQRQRLETLGRLTAGVAHDFNNMLGAISSNLAFLESVDETVSAADPEVADCLADIRGAASRAAELSQRLVTYARGEASPTHGVDVSVVIRTVERLVRRTFGQAIVVKTETDEHLPVAADGLDVHQVLMNLCLNARDAMPDGGTVWIDAHATDDGRVEIAVRDEGMGIPEAIRAKIFEPFFSTKGKRGFGVGLSTCREIVVGLGGDIGVESFEGQGSTFRVHLPAATEILTPATRSSTLMPPSDLDLPSIRVMVVDDEVYIRRSCRRILEQRGHEVVEAADGRQAIKLYAGPNRPDVVLLDIEMPHLDGVATLELIRELDSDARIVMMSGHPDADAGRFLARGAAAILPKPWRGDELMVAVRSALAEAHPIGRTTTF